MAGVTFIIGPAALQGLGSNLWGQLAVLGATFSYGLAGVYGRQFGPLPVSVTTAGFLLGGALPILPLAIFLEQPWTLQPSWASLGSVLTLAIFNTAIAFLIWTTLIRRAGATATAQVTFVIPIISIILGYVVLNEQIAWTALIGLVFILFGLAVSQNKLSFFQK